MKQSEKRSYGERIGSIVLPILMFGVVCAGAGGCGEPHFASEPVVVPPKPSVDVQAAVEQTATRFVSAMNSKDYALAQSLTTGRLRSATISDKHLLDGPSSPLRPFSGATDVKFESVQSVSKGAKAVLRMQFRGSDSEAYHASLLLAKVRNEWNISEIGGPAKRKALVGKSGAVSGKH